MLRRTALSLLLLFLLVSFVSASQMDILPNVHGYQAGGVVLVPFRGLAEWLGATVEFHNPTILMQQGDSTVQLTLGSKSALVNGRTVTLQVAPKAYGGVTCVPLRFVAEAFGVQPTYHAAAMDMSMPLAGLPFVELQGGGKTARVVVHAESPDVVAAIIADLEPTAEGDYGDQWIISIQKVGTDTVKVTGPVWYTPSEQNFSPTEMSDAGLVRVKGHWRFTPEGEG